MSSRVAQVFTIVSLLAVPGPLFAQSDKEADPQSNVSGTWNMGLQGDHVIQTALVLKQEDKRRIYGRRRRPDAPSTLRPRASARSSAFAIT